MTSPRAVRPHSTARHLLLIGLAAIGLAAAALLAQFVTSADAAHAEDTGTIAGTVSAPAGLALPDQMSFSLSRDGSYYYGGSSGYAPSTGTFTLAGLPAGSYTLQYYPYSYSSSAPSYLSGWYGGTSQDSATTITVTAGATSTANITLTAGGKISGTITAPAGLALPDQVSFSLYRDGSYYYGS
ncbi:hypothetical protein QT381_10450, partial [Galbitalea sp. SE-J8]|nr:hypothetical protein [Galbitalea sp. SE-J8]